MPPADKSSSGGSEALEEVGILNGRTTWTRSRAHHDSSAKQGTTPLPRLQVLCSFLIQIAEGINVTMLFPFLPFYMEHLGFQGKSTSLAAGFTAAMFCLGQTVSSIPWGSFSDRFGRRPALLIGMLGSATSLLVFGSAKTLAQAAFGRFIGGVLNGNVGVLKVWIAEFCDETNAAQGLATLPTAWGIGVVLGPSIGGLLAQPAEQYPHSALAQSPFLREYPFLLPCITAAAITYLIMIVCFAFVEETLPYKPESCVKLVTCCGGSRSQYKAIGGKSSSRSFGDIERGDDLWNSSSHYGAKAGGGNACSMLKDGALRSVVFMYFMCALIYIILDETIPFLLRERRDLGGGGMPQARIGILIAIGGGALLTGPWIVPPLEKRFGRRRCIKFAFWLLIPVFLAFPVSTFSVSLLEAGVWSTLLADVLVVSLLAVKNILGSLAFTMAFLFINSSVNNDSARLGLINGISQMGAAVARSAGPLMAGGLWAVGLDIVWGPCFLTFAVLAGLNVGAVRLASGINADKEKPQRRAQQIEPDVERVHMLSDTDDNCFPEDE